MGTDPAAAGEHAPSVFPGAETVDRYVDATGLSCPMPVIELAQAIEQVSLGEVVGLTATDPAARVDVPVWCRMQRHHLRSMHETDGAWHFQVARAR